MKLGEKVSYLSTSLIKYLREIYAATYIGIKIYFRYVAWVIGDLVTTPIAIILLLTPILLFLPPDQWNNPDIIQNFFWGIVLWDLISMSLWSIGNSIRNEQRLGTLEQLLLTNANRAILFTRSMISRLLSFSLSTIYMYFFLQLFFGKPIVFRNPLTTLTVLLLAIPVSLGFGLLYGAIVLWIKNPGPITNILQFIILGLSGVFYPVTRLPRIIQYFSYMLPFTYLADLLRHEAMGIPTVFPVFIEVIIVVAYAVIANLVGYAILLYIEKRMKKVGKLGFY